MAVDAGNTEGKRGEPVAIVFTAVGNKQAVLKVVRDVALAGDDEPLDIAERPPFQAVLAEPNATAPWS
jgi:hypothetical protein